MKRRQINLIIAKQSPISIKKYEMLKKKLEIKEPRDVVQNPKICPISDDQPPPPSAAGAASLRY